MNPREDMSEKNLDNIFNEILDSAIKEGKELTAECRGSCMESLLADGDQVSFKKVNVNELKWLDLIMFRDREKNSFVTHRFIKTTDINGSIFIIARADTLRRYDIPIPEEDFVGRITRIEKSNKVIYLNTLKGRARSYINFFIAPPYLSITKIKPKQKKEYFKNENELLTSITRITMDRDSIIRAGELLSKELNWDYIFNKIRWNSIAPFFMKNVINTELGNQVSPEIQGRIELIFATISRSLPKIRSELKNILSAFNRSNIKVIVIAGAHLGEEIYGDTFLRRMNDIDMLVRFDDWPEIKDILEKLGFRFKGDDYIYWGASHSDNRAHFHKKEVTLELLFSLWYMDFPFFENDLRQGAREITLVGEKALVPSIEDTLLIACINMTTHNYMGLMWVCDIKEIIERFRERIDWDAVIRRAKEKDIDCSAYYALYYSSKLLNYRIPEDVLERLKPSLVKRKLHNFFWNEKVILWKEEGFPCRANIGRRVPALLFNGKMNFKPKRLLQMFSYIIGVIMPKRIYMARYYEIDRNSPKLIFYYLLRIVRFFLVIFDIFFTAILGKKRKMPLSNRKAGYRLFLRPDRFCGGYKIDNKT